MKKFFRSIYNLGMVLFYVSIPLLVLFATLLPYYYTNNIKSLFVLIFTVPLIEILIKKFWSIRFLGKYFFN